MAARYDVRDILSHDLERKNREFSSSCSRIEVENYLDEELSSIIENKNVALNSIEISTVFNELIRRQMKKMMDEVTR